jgi:hypothetical protein
MTLPIIKIASPDSGGFTGMVVLRAAKFGETPDSLIVEYLMGQASEETYVDFVTVASTGADTGVHKGKYMGSVARGVIQKSNLNVIYFS